MKYIGDISLQDAHVLATFAGRASAILEFGVGGSTQVIAQSKSAGASFFTLETEPAWIRQTSANLKALGLPETCCAMLPYADWFQQLKHHRFDLIFVDGADAERLPFALAAWPLLKIGGWMLFHDTRRWDDMHHVLQLVAANYLEIDEMHCNLRASNITAVSKKIAEPYVNWNNVEGRSNWQAGYEPPPPNFPTLLR